MTLIKSISGIRGTIGGQPGEGLSPVDIVKYTAAFGQWCKNNHPNQKNTIVIGRDARSSGDMVNKIICGTLMGMGIDVLDTGLTTTPTVEMAVTEKKAEGGIIITASHNPKEWNALKLLNSEGEFLSADDGNTILNIADNNNYSFVDVGKIGKYFSMNDATDMHIQKIIELDIVLKEKIQNRNFTVVVDAVNSVGGIAIPQLLETLGVKVIPLYCEPNGEFPHNPEPLPENLEAISKRVKEEKADMGIVVDPDVDRLAIINEDGSMFGEEYTLVAVADYILSHKKGNTVSNMSSSMALRDVTLDKGGKYYSSPVGEVNVVAEMKKVNAVIGGEGNGGVIFPGLHYGRDALVGIALFLSHIASLNITCSKLRNSYPDYYISKNKIKLEKGIHPDHIIKEIETIYKNEKTDRRDGIKITFNNEWVHLRKSNTEPIIRIYAESTSKENADKLSSNIKKIINDIQE